jgi:hypothetical protein
MTVTVGVIFEQSEVEWTGEGGGEHMIIAGQHAAIKGHGSADVGPHSSVQAQETIFPGDPQERVQDPPIVPPLVFRQQRVGLHPYPAIFLGESCSYFLDLKH